MRLPFLHFLPRPPYTSYLPTYTSYLAIQMILGQVDAPPLHPAAPTYPMDGQGRPLYPVPQRGGGGQGGGQGGTGNGQISSDNPTNHYYYQTSGCVGIDGAGPAAVAQTTHLLQLAQLIQQMAALSQLAGQMFSGTLCVVVRGGGQGGGDGGGGGGGLPATDRSLARGEES